ncbi:MAG: sulfur carrier protein ThiS [Pseudomonadota bacterium]|nr:sulfur carrier protein ThiS [Pseudomonadota bacterium]
MQVRVNGEAQELAAGTTIAGLLEQLELQGRRLAVERNEEIVPRAQHASTELQAGDELEIVHAIGGG